jgi:dephospho-CoA kinase
VSTTKKRPYIVGLTGGIGAGKSTVTRFWLNDKVHSLGASAVFDCDAAVHLLYQDHRIIDLLSEHFGDVGNDARKFCTNLVMEDPLRIDDLEKIFIPAVKIMIEDNIRTTPYNILIIDAPLLFETDLHKMCDVIVVVQCLEEQRRDRVLSRPGMTEAKLDLMLSRQITDEIRNGLADIVINNSNAITIQDLHERCAEVLAQLRIQSK